METPPKITVLDFRVQAEQVLQFIEAQLKAGKRGVALEFMILKFKALYEQGVVNGRKYEQDGTYPFTHFSD